MLMVWAHQDAECGLPLRLSPLFHEGAQIFDYFFAPLVKPDCTTADITLDRGRLGLEYVALVDPPAAKEAVAHHLLAEKKNEAEQDDQEKELYDSQPRRLSCLGAAWV